MSDDDEEELTELQEWEACEKFRAALKKGVPRQAVVLQMEAQDLDPALLSAPKPDPPAEDDDEEEDEEEGDDDEEEELPPDGGVQAYQDPYATGEYDYGQADTGVLGTVALDVAAYARLERRLLLLFEAEKDHHRAELADELRQAREDASATAAPADQAGQIADLTAQLTEARAEAADAVAAAANARADLQERPAASPASEALSLDMCQGCAQMEAEREELRQKLRTAEEDMDAVMEEATDEQAKLMAELEAVKFKLAQTQVQPPNVCVARTNDLPWPASGLCALRYCSDNAANACGALHRPGVL